MRSPIWILTIALVTAACGKHEAASTAPPTPTAQQPAPSADTGAIDAALHSADRLSGDADEDTWRHPAEVLAFLQVRPGQHVIDYFAGGGYFTELLSRVVGPTGRVIAYNNAGYLKFAADKPAQRYGNQRLANVEQLTTPPEELPVEPNSLDAALFFLSYHDLHWVSKKRRVDADRSCEITLPIGGGAKARRDRCGCGSRCARRQRPSAIGRCHASNRSGRRAP